MYIPTCKGVIRKKYLIHEKRKKTEKYKILINKNSFRKKLVPACTHRKYRDLSYIYIYIIEILVSFLVHQGILNIQILQMNRYHNCLYIGALVRSLYQFKRGIFSQMNMCIIFPVILMPKTEKHLCGCIITKFATTVFFC